MVVVADTTLLNYLILIDQVHLLPEQFDSVLIPKAVFLELTDEYAPELVRRFVLDRPRWLQVHDAAEMRSPYLQDLDRGEREVIELALQLNLTLVLMDETKGCNAAAALGLRLQGVLGTLDKAALQGRCDFAEALERLKKTTFRMSRALRSQFLDRHRRP